MEIKCDWYEKRLSVAKASTRFYKFLHSLSREYKMVWNAHICWGIACAALVLTLH